MTVVRRIARPMLASVFLWGGVEALRNPVPKEPAASRVGPSIAAKIPYLPEDPESLVKLNGAVQVGAGAMLALGRFPRLSSLLLAGSLIPTTLAGHRFWEEDDPAERYRQRGNFLKNVGLLGGLILAAVDTEGQPGLAWRAKHATHHAAEGTRRARKTARREARLAAHAARAHLPG
ncbi:MAG: putative oxidoreductase [Actinomycetota bacterium]|jgi:putative oxidoreductase|nr:putative oxidoreductase [Actinomycetota bacterium]